MLPRFWSWYDYDYRHYFTSTLPLLYHYATTTLCYHYSLYQQHSGSTTSASWRAAADPTTDLTMLPRFWSW